MEAQIIEKVGRNKTKEKGFTNDFSVTDSDEETNTALGFYTYRGELYILTGDGMDTPFQEFDEESQKKIFKEITNDNYK